ncbi:hypothetical protein [Actinokineospora sp.]
MTNTIDSPPTAVDNAELVDMIRTLMETARLAGQPTPGRPTLAK